MKSDQASLFNTLNFAAMSETEMVQVNGGISDQMAKILILTTLVLLCL